MIRRSLVVATVCSLLVASCGLGDKQAQAEAIIDSVDRVIEAGSARGRLSIAQAFVSGSFPGGGVAIPAGGSADDDQAADGQIGGGLPIPSAADMPPIAVDVALDLVEGVAAASFPNAEHPYGVFDQMDLYARRYNAGERDARPWAHVRGDRLQKDSGGLATREAVYFYAGFALNPMVLLDLASAPLTGSIEVIGTEQVAGVETTHYEANFDIEKMLEDTREDAYPEERREMVDTLFNLLVIRGNTHSGEVWLDGDGLLRRFRITMRQNPFADLNFDLVLTLELAEIGGPISIARPGPRELVSVGSIRSFLNAAVPAPDSEDFVRTVVGVASV